MNIWSELLSVCSSKLMSRLGVVFFIAVLSRLIQTDSMGVYLFMFAVTNFFSMMMEGVGRAVRKRVSEKEGKRTEYLAAGFGLSLGLFVIVGVATLLVILFLDELPEIGVLKLLTPGILIGGYLFFVTQSVGKLAINYAAGLGDPGRAEWVGKALPGILFFILTLGILKFGYGLALVFVAGSISYGLSVLLLVLISKPKLRARPEREHFESVITFSKWSVPNEMVNDFYNKIDIVMLGVVVTAISVSYYEVSENVASIVFTVSYGVFSVSSVKISGLHAQNMSIKPVMDKFLGLAGYFPLAALSIYIVVGQELLVAIFRPEFAAAYLYLIGMGIHQVMSGYRKTFEGFFQGVDKPDRTLYANIGGVIVNVLTILPLIYAFGGVGVVLSTLLSGAVQLALFIHYALQENITLGIPRVVPIQFASATITATVFYIGTQAIELTLPYVIVVAVAMVVVYTAIILLFSQNARRSLDVTASAVVSYLG